MPDGAGVEAQLNELKNAIYYLSELMQRQAAPAAPQGVDKLDSLGKNVADLSGRVDNLSDSLGWVARQSSELSSLLKAVEARAAGQASKEDLSAVAKKLDSIQPVKPEELHSVAERVEKLADSLGWVARQSSELSAATGAVSKKLEELPTRDQLSQWSRSVSTSTEASAAEVVSKVDSLKDQFRSLDGMAKSFEALSRQSLLMSQNLDALTARMNETSSRMDSIPTREQMGQFASMVETRLGEVSAEVSKTLEQKLGQVAQRMEQRMDSSVSEFQAVSSKIDAKLAESAKKAEQQIEATAAELRDVSQSLDAKLAESARKAEQQMAATSAELKEVSQSIDARLAPVTQLQAGMDRLAEEYSKSTNSLKEVHDQFEFQKRQAEALAEALTVIHRDLNHESETLDALDKKTVALGEALATVGAAATDSAAKLSELGASNAQAAQQGADAAAKLDAIFPKLESLAQSTSAASAALSSRSDAMASRLEEQRKLLEGAAAQVVEVSSATGEAHKQIISDLSVVAAKLEGQLSRMEKMEGLTALAEKEESESIAAVRDMSAQLETQRRQLETLASLPDNVDKALVRVESRSLETAQKGAEAQAQQLGAIAEAVDSLRKELAAHREENRTVVEALTSLVKEVARMEQEMAQNKVEPEKLYSDMQKRFMASLAEKLTKDGE